MPKLILQRFGLLLLEVFLRDIDLASPYTMNEPLFNDTKDRITKKYRIAITIGSRRKIANGFISRVDEVWLEDHVCLLAQQLAEQCTCHFLWTGVSMQAGQGLVGLADAQMSCELGELPLQWLRHK